MTMHSAERRSAPFFVLNGMTVLLVAAFSVLPLFYIGYLSLVNLKTGQLVGGFVGLENYHFVLETPATSTVFWNTFYFSTLSVVLSLFIGVVIALLMDSKLPFSKLLIAAVILPWAIPEVVNALVWKWVFDYNWGALNALLKALGIIDTYQSWFSDGTTAMHCLIFAYSWKIVPFVVIINFAALRAIPSELVESAQIDGAGWFALLWHVRLPLILPALAVALLFCVIFSMRAFDLVYLLTKGGPGEATSVLSYYTYATTFEFGDIGAGSAISVMLAGATLVATAVYWHLLQRLERDR
jgi:multiple sugar transport system permease protein